MPTKQVMNNAPMAPANQIINTTTDNNGLSPEVADFFGNYLGMVAKKRCVLHYLATQLTLPTKSGSNIVVPTFRPLKATTAALTEGVTPDGLDIERHKQIITPKQFGNYTTITDVVALTVQDHSLQNAADLLGMHLAEVCDLVIGQELASAQNIYTCNGIVPNPSANNVGSITEQDLRYVVNKLKLANAYQIAPMLFGSQMFGSTPVTPAYYCYARTEIEPDLNGLPAYFPVSQYGSSASAHWLPGEVGECCGIRFVLSNNIPLVPDGQNGAAADKPVYNNFVLGKYAYYTTSLGLRTSEFIFGSGGFDPLRQRITVAYKTWFGCKLNEANPWLVRMLCRTSQSIRANP